MHSTALHLPCQQIFRKSFLLPVLPTWGDSIDIFRAIPSWWARWSMTWPRLHRCIAKDTHTIPMHCVYHMCARMNVICKKKSGTCDPSKQSTQKHPPRQKKRNPSPTLPLEHPTMLVSSVLPRSGEERHQGAHNCRWRWLHMAELDQWQKNICPTNVFGH